MSGIRRQTVIDEKTVEELRKIAEELDLHINTPYTLIRRDDMRRWRDTLLELCKEADSEEERA